MTALYIVIAIVVVVVIGLLAVTAMRRRQTGQLRSRFGPEYDRTVESAGDRRQAETELRGRSERRRQYELRPLDALSQQRYVESWRQVQASFVDEPAESVRQADRLVGQVMTERGYPTAEFDQRAADVSVDHPDVVESYRAAHAISVANDEGQASTEDLRRAMTQYRELFARLLGSDTTAGAATPAHPGASPTSASPQMADATARPGTPGSAAEPPPPAAGEGTPPA
jgi:hypothetical protein